MENMRELSMEEMDKISGGAGNHQDCKFYELDVFAQDCIERGYCPNCGPEQPILKLGHYYRCRVCRLSVQFDDY